MKMHPSDPDIETLVGRIERGELDLQPDFQRGEVWSEVKRQRLIDSILRRWHIPPIHVLGIEDSSREEVLDGQQRLATIRDFTRGLISINGSIPPLDDSILGLDGRTLDELPDDVRKRINRFTLRQFTLTDYRPAEPAELFFRLNQLTALTPAEQRNAFVGPAREQVKDLTSLLESSGVDKTFVGFSNSRMSYDEVIARLALAASNKNILTKITANDLADVYRSSSGFDSHALRRCAEAIELFAASRPYVRQQIRLNKATMFSWLWFLVEARAWKLRITPEVVGSFVEAFEVTRQERFEQDLHPAFRARQPRIDRAIYLILEMYEDRSTSRVGDVFSVLLRDLVLWAFFDMYSSSVWSKGHSHLRNSLRTFMGLAAEGADELIAFVNATISERRWGIAE